MDRPNIYETEVEGHSSSPAGFEALGARLTQAAGGKELALNLFEIPSGQKMVPYHYEYDEEWLILLEGTVELRTPTGTETLKRGDVVCFPAGPEGAHQVTNLADEPARAIMFSRQRAPSVCVYPDTDKVGLWAGPDDDYRFYKADGNVDYWVGETE